MHTKPFDQAFKYLVEQDPESLLLRLGAPQPGEQELAHSAKALACIDNEVKQREMSLHFLLLGGLRYNRADLLELMGRGNMIPLEQLKESGFYQMILQEGREEGELQGIREMLCLLATHRFPGISLEADLARIHNADDLKQLGLELEPLPNTEALRQRLAQLITSGNR